MRLPLTVNQGACQSRVISLLPPDIIHPNPYQPRTHFEQKALEELCASIKCYGILQPLTVRRLGDAYELIAGERRLRAAKMAGLTCVPAVIVNLDAPDSALIALLENLQRQDLSFLEEAEGYEKLVRLHGLTQEQIAEKIGKTQSTVANKLRLLKLPPAAKKMIKEHALTERHARALLRLGADANAQLEVLGRIIERSLNVTQTEALIDSYLNKPAPAESQAPLRMMNRRLHIATNTLKQAVSMINSSGIHAVLKEKKTSAYVEYTITLPL